jgi:hypothetical protein
MGSFGRVSIQPQTGVHPRSGYTHKHKYTDGSWGSHRPAGEVSLHTVSLRRVT